MKAEILQIAKNRLEAIKKDSKLSTAPYANSELVKFMENNEEISCLVVMKEYAKQFKSLQFKSFQNAI